MTKNISTKKLTPEADLLSKVKAFTKEFKKIEREIVRNYDSQIAKLVKERDQEMKTLRKNTTGLVSAISPLTFNPNEVSKKSTPSVDKKPKVKVKRSSGNKKPKSDEVISAELQDAFKDATTEFRTEDLLKKLDVGYPRLNKYTKSKDSIIVFKGSKKKGTWSLKS